MTRCTTCPYCGVGCGVTLSADAHHPANLGRLCVKGAALGDTLGHEGRLLSPQVDGAPADWTHALDSVADRLGAIIRRHGPQAVAFYASGQLLTEDYYVANKLITRAIDKGCNTVDALGKRLRCGTNCGSCIPELKQLLARQPA